MSLSQPQGPDWQAIPNIRDSIPWHRDVGRWKLNFFLSIIFVGMILNGYDGTLISGLQAFDSWHEDLGLTDSNTRSSALIGLLNAAGPLSGIVVGPVITYIDETWGRRWGIRFYGYTIVIGTVISVIAGVPNLYGNSGYAIFVVGRFIIGFGLAAFLITSLIIVQEMPHPRTRSTVSQSWNSYYIMGMVIGGWVNFGCSYITGSWQWRLPYILQIPMAVYLLITVQFMPETPRFLISKGRDAEALNFLVKYHGNGDPNDPLVLFEYEEIRETLDRERLARAEKWSVILRSRSNRHRLGLAALMTNLAWLSGNSIIYYYYSVVFDLVGITGATTQTGIAAGLNVFCYFCQIAAVYVGKYVGRKRILLWTWPFLLLCLIGLCVAGGMFAKSGDTDHKSAVATVVLVWLFLGSFNFTNPVLWSYPSEVLTYSMRSKGMLFWNTVTQVQTVYVTFVDSIALNAIGYKYYAVYMPILIIQWLLVKFYMVETKGYTLEEVAFAFDSRHSSTTDVSTIKPADGAGAAMDDPDAKVAV